MCFVSDGKIIQALALQLSKSRSPELDKIVGYLRYLREPSESFEIPPFAWSALVPPFTSGYYTYKGSLTAPPCTESVYYFINQSVGNVSDKQVAKQFCSQAGLVRAKLLLGIFHTFIMFNSQLFCQMSIPSAKIVLVGTVTDYGIMNDITSDTFRRSILKRGTPKTRTFHAFKMYKRSTSHSLRSP